MVVQGFDPAQNVDCYFPATATIHMRVVQPILLPEVWEIPLNVTSWLDLIYYDVYSRHISVMHHVMPSTKNISKTDAT